VDAARGAALERRAALVCVDRLWAEQLEDIATLREGIHWTRFGNQDPLGVFLKRADAAFWDKIEALDADVAGSLERLARAPGELTLDRAELRGPAATWTYLVNDDPFRQALGLHVAGNMALSLGAALYAPLYIVVAAYKRWFKRS
jgi:preprotein translocase subunit SecA